MRWMEIDVTSRRNFLAGLLSVGLCPATSWADAGNPVFLSAARFTDGSDRLCGLSEGGEVVFSLVLPGRGHAAAAHPSLSQAVAFARRPGTFAFVVDCATGMVRARLSAPPGRHFYGHGVYSADGMRLFTTENDYEAARGVVGVWDVQDGYRRMGEYSSGGTGPHDIRLLPDEGTLVVANGGIETHPDSGRTKLNLPTMRSSLTYLSTEGEMMDQVVLDAAHQRNSIRHLAVGGDGEVAFAMQWQGTQDGVPPLVGVHYRGAPPRFLSANGDNNAMRGYVGSIAFSQTGRRIAVTSPRGGLCRMFDSATAAHVGDVEMQDVCGVSGQGDGFVVTSGLGQVAQVTGHEAGSIRHHSGRWDNHLIRVV